MRNKTLFIALFVTEGVPTFLLTQFLYSNYILSSLVPLFLAVSLLIAWLSAHIYPKVMTRIGYLVIFLGIALAGTHLMGGARGSGILILAVSIMTGINMSLRERRMLGYLLIFSFMLFLYASSRVFNSYSIASVVLFAFSFFTVVVADYYNKRIHLQTQYISNVSSSFFATVFVLVLVVSSLTVGLYYLMPQPNAVHYGLLPFGGKKQYRGIKGESNKQSANHKSKISELPEYTTNGQELKLGSKNASQVNNTDTLFVYNDRKNIDDKQGSSDIGSIEKRLREENKYAFYSSLDRDRSSDNENSSKQKRSDILFIVKGKEARFLRGRSYDHFNGNHWQKRLKHMYTIDTRNILVQDAYYEEAFDDYQILVRGRLEGKPIIYLPIGFLRIQFPTNLFYTDTADTVYAPSQLEVGTLYTASVEKKGYYGYDASIKKDVWYKKAYLDVPGELDLRIPALAKKIIGDEGKELEKALAIIRHFQSNYIYTSAQVAGKIHNQKLETMLFKTQKGNALQFNTALVMMLRSVGVYSRIATGYAPSEYDNKTKSFVVARKNRAIWSEVFVSGRGWVALHAAEDIPLADEVFDIKEDMDLETIAAIVLASFLLSFLSYYYMRSPIKREITQWRLNRYEKSNHRDFVVNVYREIEKYYRFFDRGRDASWTVREYKEYIQTLKPAESYMMEYLSIYYNQALYQGYISSDFDSQRYLEAALFLAEHPFGRESLYTYLQARYKAVFK